MVVFRSPVGVAVRSSLFIGLCLPLFSQQSNLQIALFPRSLASVDATTSETDSGTYMSLMGKRPAPFRPTGSDLMIGKAEEVFQSGKRAYQLNDTETARTDFDAAIDYMLQASDNPTDRRLFEEKLEQMVDVIHRFDLAGLGAGAPVEEAQFEKAPLDDILQMTFPVDPKIKGKVTDEVKETSSQLPLAVNDAVLSYINYFSGRGRRTIIAGLERSARYQPMISRILAEEGVPQELIHLAQAESGFLPRAVSNMAAVGMWQFVQWRGNQYGLKQTPFTDDRLDPEKATRAAARHLHDLYNEFGDWYLAIAAYNCGPANIEKAVQRTGYADFWALRDRHVLPVETTNYVPIILAMTIMSKNAAAYGLTDVNPEPVLEYDTVKVSSPTHLALVGDLTDAPVSQLLAMNPALLKSIAPADYELHVPKNSGDQLRAALEMFPAERRTSWRMHRVESGETLAGIARQFNTAASSIEDANRISTNGPQAGDRLIIPASFREPAGSIHIGKAIRRGHAAPAHRMLARGGLTHSSLARNNATHVAALRARVRPKTSESHVAARVHRTAAHRA